MAVNRYKLDSSRVTLKEYAWEVRNPLTAVALPIAMVAKLLRIRLPGGSTDDLPVESLAPFAVAETELPAAARERMAPRAAKLGALGFCDPSFYAVAQAPTGTNTYLTVLRHQDGQAMACVHERDWMARHPPKIKFFVDIVTAFADGTFLLTTSAKPDMLTPASHQVRRMVDAAPAALWAAHQDALRAPAPPAPPAPPAAAAHRAPMAAPAPPATRKVLGVDSPEMLVAVLEHHHAAVRDFHVQRGVFVPLSEAEQAKAGQQEADARTLRDRGFAHADVLAELDRSLLARRGWGAQLALLVVTAAAFFVMSRGGQWSLSTLAILMGVLFFHELGHYLAMQIFRYRNVSMFFIPMFGAAVIGRNLSAPGWKKALVALAGPLPGIAVGAVLGVVGMILGQHMLVTIALWALGINALNLLPVLPLDGGQVVQAVLFSRHYILDALFRVAAILVLLVAAFFLTQYLVYIALAMALSLPATIKLGRIAMEMRKAGPIEPPTEAQTIPPAVAQEIVSRVVAAFPRGMGTKITAQRARLVYETVNAGPPNWFATIGLLGLHGGAFLVAVVLASVLFIAGRTGLGNMVKAMQRGPKTGLVVRDMVARPAIISAAAAPRPARLAATLAAAAPATEPAGPTRTTLVATYHTAAEARQSFDELSARAPADIGLSLVGQSVMVALPDGDSAARQKWLVDLKAGHAEVVVNGSTARAVLSVLFNAPTQDDADALQGELNDYFRLNSGMNLIPPWQSPDPRSAEARSRNEVARRTICRLASAGTGLAKDPAMTALNAKIKQAIAEGDKEALKRLQVEQMKGFADARRRARESIVAGGAPKVDVAVAKRYMELLAANQYGFVAPAALREFGPVLGQLPGGDGGTAPAVPPTDDASALDGYVTQAGLLITVHSVSFKDLVAGPPAFLHWLDRKGCANFRYEVTSQLIFSGDEDD